MVHRARLRALLIIRPAVPAACLRPRVTSNVGPHEHMRTIVVISHSVTGRTAQLAGAVARGIELAGASARAFEILGKDIVEGRYVAESALAAIDEADAVVFGAPTFMGGPSAQFKAFADATSDRWETQRWSGKLAAGFTSGGYMNGDQTSTLRYFALLAAQHGMLWLGVDIAAGADKVGRNRLGVQLGAAAYAPDRTVEATDLETAAYLGRRVAQTASQFRGG